jgi:hypothetical protein
METQQKLDSLFLTGTIFNLSCWPELEAILNFLENVSLAGLPDFSCYNIPKRDQIYKMSTYICNMPKGCM